MPILGPVFKGNAFAHGHLPVRVLADVQRYERIVNLCLDELLAEGGFPPAGRRAMMLAISALKEGSCRPAFVADVDGDNDLFAAPPMVVAASERANRYLSAAALRCFADVPDAVLEEMKDLGQNAREDESIAGEPGDQAARLDANGRDAIRAYLRRPLVPREVVEVGTITGSWDGRGGRKFIQLDSLSGKRFRMEIPKLDIAKRAGSAYDPDAGRRATVRVRFLALFRDGQLTKAAEAIGVDVLPGPDLNLAFAELKSLRDDWDGQGAVVPAESAIRDAQAMLREALIAGGSRCPVVVATASGEVWGEWLLSTRPVRRVVVRFAGDGSATCSASGESSVVRVSAGGEIVSLLARWLGTAE